MKNRFLKMLLCVICVVTLVATSCGAVFATMNDVIFDLQSLGVLDKIENDGDMDALITRGEFAMLIVNAMGYSQIAESMAGKGYFADTGNTPYVGAINLLYELNIISGTGANTFSPDANLTYPQVGKITVNMLGYSNIVKNKDLNSYFYQAGIIGVYDDVDSAGEFVSRGDAYIIIHNCLNIDIMTENFKLYGTGSYAVEEGNTLKSYLQTAQHHRLTKHNGVVTADNITYLYNEISKNRTDIIEIDDVIYKCNFDVPRGLVGMNVDFYVEYNDESSPTITAITPTDENMVVEFELNSFISAVDGTLKYNENDDTKKIKYSDTTKMIYNNRRERTFTPKNIGDYESGVLRAIDNNEDEIYDIMYITQYDDAIVEKVYTETKQVYFANSLVLYGSRYISLDDEEIIVNITDAEGNVLGITEIPEDSVISISKSNDNKVISVVVSQKKVTGKISVIDEEYITIDSDVYVCASNVTPELGKHVDAYINFRNEIVYLSETVSYDNYAYVLMVANPTGLGDTKISVITPGNINETSKNSVSDDGSTDTSKKLFFRNSKKSVYTLASKVSVDGVKYSAENISGMISNQVISYSLNADGKITKIDIIKPYDNDTYKTYNENGKVFSLGSGRGFGINESSTMSICVPENIGSASDDDLMVAFMLLNSEEYRIKAYDVDEDTNIAGLVVVTGKMQAGIAGNVTAKSDVAIVKKISRKITDSDEKLVLNLITKEGEKNYFVSNLIPNASSFTQLGRGDLIAYTLIEGNDELNGFSIIQKANDYNGKFLLNAFQEDEVCLGNVADLDYNYVSQGKNRWTDCVTVDYGSGKTTYEVFMTGTPPIYLLEGENTLKTLTFDDIQIGDKIFVSANLGVVRAIVIRR